jgi:hypothetical protein
MGDVVSRSRIVHPALSSYPHGLIAVRRLLARLDEAKVAYCHWKSNEHLHAGLNGLTDLDVLVERRCASDLQCILAECGFKRFAAPPLRAYPAIEDYLGFDDDSGRIVHLHLHYQLTVGESHLKGYRLPWEHRLLATRRRDPDFGVDVADPILEMLLLLVRAGLKYRARDWLLFPRRRQGGEDDLTREFTWLRERVDNGKLRELAIELLGPAIDEPLRRLLAESQAPYPLRSFARTAQTLLRKHRTYGAHEARLRAWVRELQWLTDAVNRRYFHRPIPLRRISPRGGTIIVLLGADGSGKSTLTQTLVAWLGGKLDVMPVYLGSGDGQSAWYRRPLKLAHRLLRPFLSSTGSNSPDSLESVTDASSSAARKNNNLPRAIARVPWALALSCEKRSKIRRMLRGRNRGMIVVCDRFPQTDVAGFNDGPLLSHWQNHRWRVCRALATWEAKPYVEIGQDPPDLVIKLYVASEVALMRRPDMSLEEVRRRERAVRSISFPPSTRVAEVDANASLDQVVLAAKRLTWEEI